MELSLNMSEVDNCTFMTSRLLEQSENFEEWLDKNGVQFIINNERLGEQNCGVDDSTDPLLNQLSPAEDVSDDEVVDLVEQEDVKSEMKVPLPYENMPKFNNLTTKYEYLEHLLATKEIIYVEFKPSDDKINIMLTNSYAQIVYPNIHLSLAEIGSQINIPKNKVPVRSLQKVILANELKASMPCLHLSTTGLCLYICPQQDCSLVYTRFSAAKLHSLTQIGYKPFKCKFPGCIWAFYTSFKLRRHQDCHSNQKDFQCYIQNCGRKFTNIYNLNIHIKNHMRPATLPCEVKGCTMKFQTSRMREKHFKSHDISEAPFTCPEANCKRAFFLLTGLSSHAKSHSHKDSELRCSYPNCGRVFEQPCRLREHSRKHTGQRPYICTYAACKWSFTTASKLKRHQSTHTKERKFHCTIGTCNKSFIRSEHLREHTLTHIGSKSFKCEVCSASFFGKSALYMHYKKVHAELSDQNCARALPYDAQQEPSDNGSSEVLLEQAVSSLEKPSDIILGTELLPEEPLELLENENFSTVNLRDLE